MLVKRKHIVKASVFKLLCFIILICFISFSIIENNYLNTQATVSADSRNQLIIIDAGHGGEDCGAIAANGAYEKDLNLEISIILAKYLSNAGYSVILTREEDKLLYSE